MLSNVTFLLTPNKRHDITLVWEPRWWVKRGGSLRWRSVVGAFEEEAEGLQTPRTHFYPQQSLLSLNFQHYKHRWQDMQLQSCMLLQTSLFLAHIQCWKLFPPADTNAPAAYIVPATQVEEPNPNPAYILREYLTRNRPATISWDKRGS